MTRPDPSKHRADLCGHRTAMLSMIMTIFTLGCANPLPSPATIEEHDMSAAEANNVSALFEAIAASHGDRITTLLETNPELASTNNQQGLSPIMWSLYHRNLELADTLIAAGAVPNTFEACALGDHDTVASALDDHPELLAARAADGFTLLHLACFFGHAKLVGHLIDRGSDVDAIAANPSGVAPIHSAAANAWTPIVIRLLEARATPDAAQKGGYTALMTAARHGHIDMAKALIAAGADPSLAADDGRTSTDFAKEGKFDAMIKLLESS